MIANAAFFGSAILIFWIKKTRKKIILTLTEILNIFIMYAEHDMRLQNPLPAAKFIVPDCGGIKLTLA
jgi:hypothetical protein